ncbi:MAG: GyrI-like domain-containing protein [Flavobacteriales bacterium]|nr:GyrI-like domain-containing protein [Flavobacteriales bacterium]
MHRIEEIQSFRIIGSRIFTALAFDETAFLWQKFRTQEKEIQHRIGSDLYSIQKFPKGLNWSTFNANTLFEKWAGVTVSDDSEPPFGLLDTIIPGGRYAVFNYKGAVSGYGDFFTKILFEHLPQAGLEWDERPQFEVMKADYLGPNNPESEEEVWIPIK